MCQLTMDGHTCSQQLNMPPCVTDNGAHLCLRSDFAHEVDVSWTDNELAFGVTQYNGAAEPPWASSTNMSFFFNIAYRAGVFLPAFVMANGGMTYICEFGGGYVYEQPDCQGSCVPVNGSCVVGEYSFFVSEDGATASIGFQGTSITAATSWLTMPADFWDDSDMGVGLMAPIGASGTRTVSFQCQ